MTKVYWQPTNVLSYDAYINYLIGSRGVGKTYSLTIKMVKDYLKHGNIFATSDGFNFSQIFSTDLPVDGTGVGKGLGIAEDGSVVFHLNDKNQGSYTHSTLKIPLSW